jgi:uncharacterized membrane protein YbhN (UPF0104 family)
VPLVIFGNSPLLQGLFFPKGNSHSKNFLPENKVYNILLNGQLAMAFFSGGIQKLFEKYFPKIVSAVRLWSSKPAAFLTAFLVAWPSNLFPMAATYLLAKQLGMNVTYWQVIGIQTVSYFLAVLPISVNGYGLREVVYTTLFTALGSTLEQASALALVTRFLTVLSTLPGAIWLSSTVTDATDLENKPEP